MVQELDEVAQLLAIEDVSKFFTLTIPTQIPHTCQPKQAAHNSLLRQALLISANPDTPSMHLPTQTEHQREWCEFAEACNLCFKVA